MRTIFRVESPSCGSQMFDPLQPDIAAAFRQEMISNPAQFTAEHPQVSWRLLELVKAYMLVLATPTHCAT